VARFLRDALITIVVLVVIAVLAAYAAVANGGLSATAQPGRIERAVAGRLLRLSIPTDASTLKNPFANDAQTWHEAEHHYGDHCATCHGADGRGHTDLGEYMYPKAPDLASAAVQRQSDGALFYIIQNGVRWTGMPGWKSEHTPEETWKLVSFIRHMPQISPIERPAHDAHHPDHDEQDEGHEPHHGEPAAHPHNPPRSPRE
jgi:mono/diheme cytochrome c family protein